MNKKIINNAVTRVDRLYSKNKNIIADYYKGFSYRKNIIFIKLNMNGYTNLINKN